MFTDNQPLYCAYFGYSDAEAFTIAFEPVIF